MLGPQVAKELQPSLVGSSPGPARKGLFFPSPTWKLLQCPEEGTAFPGTPWCRACPIAVRQEDPGLCCDGETGAGPGGGGDQGGTRRDPSFWESRVSKRHRVLIGRPASPAEPAALPQQPQAGRVSGLEAGNCWRQEGLLWFHREGIKERQRSNVAESKVIDSGNCCCCGELRSGLSSALETAAFSRA